MKIGNTIHDFETIHGQSKIKTLEKNLAIEKAKVEALSDVQGKITIEKTDSSTIRFGLIGDRHIGSLYHNSKAIQSFYNYCEQEGITTIYDCGDILDGHKIYKGQEFELRDLGFESQLRRLEKESPRNIKTRFITGNHDASFKHLAGISVGTTIQEIIPEYEFLGEEQANIQFDTPNGKYVLGLIHPGGGSAYAISYRPQRIIESLEGGTKPNMLANGHFHKSEVIPSYRNVCGVQAGTFQNQTPFMARQGLAAHVGGWIIEIGVGKEYNRIKTEFIAYYK